MRLTFVERCERCDDEAPDGLTSVVEIRRTLYLCDSCAEESEYRGELWAEERRERLAGRD